MVARSVWLAVALCLALLLAPACTAGEELVVTAAAASETSDSGGAVHAAGGAAATEAGGGEGIACAPGCTDRGNCNREDGRCECALGFGGTTCQDPQMPACQASATDLPFWGTFQPKNCECYKQATTFFNCTAGSPMQTCQIGLYQVRLAYARCYSFTDKPVSEQWSDVPEKGAPGVEWNRFNNQFELTKVDEKEGRKAINLWNHDKCVALPLAACPNACHRRGVCMDSCDEAEPDRAPWCECHKGFKGGTCAEVDTSGCPNNCTGHGSCSRGYCHCSPPHFGVDCSRTKGYPPRPGNLPDRTRPIVYVYELPHSVSSPVELDDNLSDDVPIYSAYWHFMQLMLGDWAVRTEDPWAANLFYIPAFTYAYSSNNFDPAPHMKRVVEWVSETYPFYNRSKGKDHFMWFTGDHGACEAPPELAPIIKLVHFGYHADVRVQGPSVMGKVPKDPIHGCYNPARDIVTAPYNDIGFEDAVDVYAQIVRDKGEAPHRTKLFFFAGGVRASAGHKHYSGGVRQAIAESLKEQFGGTAVSNGKAGLDGDIVFIDGQTDKYRELYNTTKFCLAPHGSGFGIRLSLAMVHGCIPVVIQDHVYQPFEDVIPYDEMSVRVAKADIPDLVSILRSVTSAEESAMRLRMANHYKAYIWEPAHGGAAYNYTLHSLYKRLHHMWGELY
ncbi:hypothetical protein FOA52_005273 [Chlamydomonas sp. UWO 241]|nr:hypothetical protein FOA52_005273 [Chlamydomonas sp. UWO 241]